MPSECIGCRFFDGLGCASYDNSCSKATAGASRVQHRIDPPVPPEPEPTKFRVASMGVVFREFDYRTPKRKRGRRAH